MAGEPDETDMTDDEFEHAFAEGTDAIIATTRVEADRLAFEWHETIRVVETSSNHGGASVSEWYPQAVPAVSVFAAIQSTDGDFLANA